MKRLEFNTKTHNGTIQIPKDILEIKNKDVKVTIVWDDKEEKNFDELKLEKILLGIRNKKIFENIDPTDWQNNLRDEWE